MNRIIERRRDDLNVLVLIRGAEQYVLVFDDRHKAEALRTLGRWATDSELPFTWYDAAVLSQKIHAEVKP